MHLKFEHIFVDLNLNSQEEAESDWWNVQVQRISIRELLAQLFDANITSKYGKNLVLWRIRDGH